MAFQPCLPTVSPNASGFGPFFEADVECKSCKKYFESRVANK
jgi:hypothetical protein